jgi:hypothetical protein
MRLRLETPPRKERNISSAKLLYEVDPARLDSFSDSSTIIVTLNLSIGGARSHRGRLT